MMKVQLYYYYDYVNTNNLFSYVTECFGEETYTYTAQAMTDIETFYLPVSYYEKISTKKSRTVDLYDTKNF